MNQKRRELIERLMQELKDWTEDGKRFGDFFREKKVLPDVKQEIIDRASFRIQLGN